MIVDKIENAQLYADLSDDIAKALAFLKDTDFAQKKDGRYDIDGDNLYYIIQRYQTKPIGQGKLEAHRKYIDVQFVADGEELLGYAHLENLETQEPYNEEKDCVLYEVSENITNVTLMPGTFCILFPDDAHMPCRELNGPSNVLKVVVKVKLGK